MIKKRSGLIIEYANEERKYVKSTERKKEIMFPKKNHPNQPTTPINPPPQSTHHPNPHPPQYPQIQAQPRSEAHNRPDNRSGGGGTVGKEPPAVAVSCIHRQCKKESA